MARLELENCVITTAPLPAGQWTAAWTGPEGKGFGRIARSEAEALMLLYEALAEGNISLECQARNDCEQ